jgi:hypothetical protein
MCSKRDEMNVNSFSRRIEEVKKKKVRKDKLHKVSSEMKKKKHDK